VGGTALEKACGKRTKSVERKKTQTEAKKGGGDCMEVYKEVGAIGGRP